MTNLLLVEDSKISRETIESHIARSPDFLLLASIENAANAEIACMNGKVDLILMDVCTADDESGLKAAAAIKKHNPGIRIIIMTSMPEHSFLQKAKDCGCDGFWYKEYGDAELLDVCARVMAGESVWPAETPVLPVGSALSRDLTERELAVRASWRWAGNTRRSRRTSASRRTRSNTTSGICCKRPATATRSSWWWTWWRKS
jgi:DNA-binding NarL/FixJ family response regulator